MKTYRFDLNTIEEMNSYGMIDAVSEIFDFMSNQMKKGNTVILERRNKQMNPYTVEIFHDSHDLQDFYDEFQENKHVSFKTMFEVGHG